MTTQTVNPEMVVLAREARRMTQGELAKRLPCSQGKVSKIESGLLPVTDELLRSLSISLNFPEAFFLQQERRLGVGASEYFHRKKSALGVRLLDGIHADLELFRLHLAKLVKAVEIEQLKKLPRLDLDDFDGDPTEAARALRATWLLPRGPISNLTMAVEEAGGMIVRREFGTSLVDGISRTVPGLPPMFFLNTALPPDRYRFTLAHELAHVVMHDVPHPEIEREADRFAAELLMPAADISPSLKGITLQRLATLKQVWKVSMGALLKRAHDLGRVTERQYRHLWMQMGKFGYRTREPIELDPPQEVPMLLQEVIDYHTMSLGYSAQELGRLLLVQEEDLRIYPIRLVERTQLRVV
jgi:Zn-dependent peptidase ImmA (M78 family)/transcriptional regulator with XRE-family HTH domain